ncbi:uncharacterized protein [Apostichopus japonicus]|uniref:uncharacterized protein n=1 Tax=Stichopus japonicus TaxID=307972 RepID=UPI003AB833DF
MEFMMQFHQNSVAVSCDTMNKIHIGTLAVSQYHQLQKVFPVKDMPNYPDHDFPLGNGYKVTPVGYMKLEPKTPIELCKDVDGRHHYPFPRSGPLFMRNMIQKEMPLNIQRHANNLMEILGDESSQGKSIVVLLTDGGPDWNSKSWTVLLYLQRLFRELNLDLLCCTTYAPGQSAFNPIEHAWAPLSRKLSGVTLSATLEGDDKPPCKQTDISEDLKQQKEKKIFRRSLNELDVFWNGMTFNGFPVTSRGVSPHEKQHFSDYEDIHTVVAKGGKRKLKDYPNILEELKFIASHCDRQPGEFTIMKCESEDCSHCSTYSVRATEAMDKLRRIGGLPTPHRAVEQERFLTYLQASEVESVPPVSCHRKSPSASETACKICKSYIYSSAIDESRHNAIIHEIRKTTEGRSKTKRLRRC